MALALLQFVAAGTSTSTNRPPERWPELGRPAGATVRDALCHRAGVPSIRPVSTNDALWDWDTMCRRRRRHRAVVDAGHQARVPRQYLRLRPGELPRRRVTGRQPGAWLAEHVAGPLGADVAWGLDAEAASAVRRRRLAVARGAAARLVAIVDIVPEHAMIASAT